MIGTYPSPFFLGYDGYGTLTLTASNTVPAEPLTVGETKSFLRIDFDDDDLLIASLITAARREAEIAQRRVLVRTQWDLTFDYWSGLRIPLATPVVSVDLVQYTGADGKVVPLTAGTDYIADLTKQPATISAPWNTTWPWFSPQPSSSILIRFTAGYAAKDPFWFSTGARLKIGMLFLVSDWYTDRLSTGTISDKTASLLNTGNLRRPR